MLTNMLNAPVAELTACKDVDLPENFFNRGPLLVVSTLSHSILLVMGGGGGVQCSVGLKRLITSGFLTFSSSTQFSKMFWTTKLPVSPKATSCHIPRNASFTLAIT